MIEILYEHPAWFARLFAALDDRQVPWRSTHAAALRFEPDWKHDPQARAAWQRFVGVLHLLSARFAATSPASSIYASCGRDCETPKSGNASLQSRNGFAIGQPRLN